jgi:hypothetical protein
VEAVFCAVVQVGGFIESEPELGREITKIVGPLPLTKGEKMIFAGDLYFCWDEKQKDSPAFPLYDKWVMGIGARGAGPS